MGRYRKMRSDHLSNINPKVTHLQDNKQVWSKYTNEILLLGKELADHKLCEICIREIDVLKSQFERLTEFYSKLKSCCDAHTNNPTKEELEKRIRLILMDHVGAQTLKKEELKVQKDQSLADENMGITDQRVREIVRHAIQIYDADKTGRVDYALESAGGQIISTRCTQRYDIRTRAYKLLAFTLYHENNNPRIVIQGNPIQPGVCWAFQGFPGYLLIKLRSSVYVTGFTVEHVPKSIVSSEEMKSAPKKFNVWGFLDENDLEPIMFGDYEFVISDDNLQYFPVQNRAIKVPYEYVELRVHSNHGQLEYTSLYRFRVHGKPVSVIHE